MELIKVGQTEIAGKAAQTVYARDMHAFLGVRKDFSNWIKVQIDRAHLVEGEDFLVFAQKGENPLGGRPSNDYALTLEAGKHIAMMAGTAKGRQVRAYFIECERQIHQQGVTVMPPALSEEDRKTLFGTFTKIARREIETATGALRQHMTEQNRHLWRALTKPRNAVHLQAVGFVELGGVYRLAGLEPGAIPAQGKLSGNIGRALDSFCRRNGVLVQSASIGTRDVTHWPKDAAVAWLADQGHEMIRNHITMNGRGKVTHLRSVS